MKHRAFTIWEALAVLGLILLLAFILFPVFNRARDCTDPKSSCQSNLKQIGLAFFQYTQDYDDFFPPTAFLAPSAKAPKGKDFAYGWADVLQPYLHSTRIYQCPSDDNCDDGSQTPQLTGYTDYYYNGRLAQISVMEVEYVQSIVMLGDGNDGYDNTDASYAYNSLPGSWRQDKNSPAYRHLEGASYTFFDGHVKWFKPEKITNQAPAKNTLTFRIR